MKKLFMVTAAFTIFAAPIGGAAHAEGLGSLWAQSPEEIRAAYPTAATARNGSVVEIKAATLAGVRWSRVELRFDDDRQLVHMKLWTDARSYGQLESELADSNDPLWTLGSDDGNRASAQKVMLCDYGADGVALSFDQPSVALPKTITASLGAGKNDGAAR
jgi:hypothetical protein